MTSPPVVDCDSYVWEPDAVWERYLDAAYRVAARSAFYHHRDDAGITTIILNGKPARAMNRTAIVRQAVWRVGMTPEDVGALDPDDPPPITPGANDAAARLADMDAMGVDAAVLFPTLFAEYLPAVENPDLAYALARAYNDWVHDLAGADRSRLIPAALLPFQDPGFAVAECRRAAGKGFKAVFVRPAFLESRFISHPSYAPVWRELEAQGLAVFVHPSQGNTGPERASTGGFVERVASRAAIGHDVAPIVAPVMDNATALTAFAFLGHMEEYPNLRLGFAGAGASWLTLALEKSETYLAFLSNIRDVSLDPAKVFFNRPSIVTYDSWETSVPRQHDVLAGAAAWGSRYPQQDTGTLEEAKANIEAYGVPGSAADALLGGNAARFLGL